MSRTKRTSLFIMLMLFLLPQFSGQTTLAEIAPKEKLNRSVVIYLGSSLVLANQQIKYINGDNHHVKPVMKDGQVMVPAAFIAENLNAGLSWDEKTAAVTITHNCKTVKFRIGSDKVWVNGRIHQTDIPPWIANGTTFVPLRLIGETFEKHVFYDQGLIIISDHMFDKENDKDLIADIIQLIRSQMPYQVFEKENFLEGFEVKDDAIGLAKKIEYASVRTADGDWIWDNYPPYIVYQGENLVGRFYEFKSAVAFAKTNDAANVYLRNRETPVWDGNKPIKASVLLDAPLISQLPELPRGCEVTSLAMLLNFAGKQADKMTLAKEIKRDPTSFMKKGQLVFFGNPYYGFVGDMYAFSTPGYGVYHGPIKELAEKYLPGQIVDLTGSDFDMVYYFLSQGKPVWVITNTWFNTVPESYWQTWHTPQGKVRVTMKEHSVLVTGYDRSHIYFNDPFANTKNRKVPTAQFIAGWKQMGKQAISYVE